MSSAYPRCLVVIPARGGSKGIPGKNLQTVGGVPLVARAVTAARGAQRVDRVIVSTDSPQIARAAVDAGAETLDRPAAISGDAASSESAVLHCLETLRTREQYEPDLTVLMQCTSPFTSAGDLDGLLETLDAHGADSAFTVARFHGFLWRPGPDGVAQPVNHQGARRQRRQDLTAQYLETGAAYAMRTGLFITSGERFCGKCVPHVLESARAIELDEPDDLAIANALAPVLESRAARPPRRDRLPSAVIFDFDGVMTDNAVFLDAEGRELVRCDRGDGLGLEHLRRRGVPLLILSKETNPVVSARARKLGIECLHGVEDKPAVLKAWLETRRLSPSEAVYVGNDINDLGCFSVVGVAACPRDAVPEVRARASLVLNKPGGHGAVRELCEWILGPLDPGSSAA